MKRTCIGIMTVALFSLVGCDNNSTPGGPGATKPANKAPMTGQADETFRLDLPMLSTKIKQGESKSVSVGVKRGKNTEEDVTLKFEDLPKGVTIEPAMPPIKHGETENKITVKAAEDAALGDFTIKVIGHPTRGADASSNFKITVEKK